MPWTPDTQYSPTSTSQYSAKDMNANFQGATFDPTKGNATNCDFKVVNDHITDGGRMITTGVTLGDNIDVQVIDKDNIMGYGANTVLKQFVTAWPLSPGSNLWDFSVNYPAKIYNGLYIRIIYHSVAGALDADPKMNVGYRLHKVLW